MSLEIAALKRLHDLDEIAAAYVYNDEGHILAAAVPPHYNDATLIQLTLRIRSVTELVLKARTTLKEIRLSYEGYSLWLKTFGKGMCLVVFVLPHVDRTSLRQPINLTVVNLEKAILGALDADKNIQESRMLSKLAHQAEIEIMMQESGADGGGAYEKISTLAEYFLGPMGPNTLEKALREKQMRLPLQKRADAQTIVELCAARIHNIERKKFFLETAMDMIERLEIEWNKPKA